MGFSQLLYLDLLELRKTDVIESITSTYVSESLQEETKEQEEEEDLFSTSYGGCEPV